MSCQVQDNVFNDGQLSDHCARVQYVSVLAIANAQLRMLCACQHASVCSSSPSSSPSIARPSLLLPPYTLPPPPPSFRSPPSNSPVDMDVVHALTQAARTTYDLHLGLRSGFESPDLDRPGRLPHQQGLCEARLGYRDGSPQLGAPGPGLERAYGHCISIRQLETTHREWRAACKGLEGGWWRAHRRGLLL